MSADMPGDYPRALAAERGAARRPAQRTAAVDHVPLAVLVGLPRAGRVASQARLGEVADPLREDRLHLRPLRGVERDPRVIPAGERLELAAQDVVGLRHAAL